MKRAVESILSLGMVAWLLVGCGAGGGSEAPDTVALIGQVPISYQEFEGFLERSVGLESVGLESRVMSALFRQFLDERLLVRLAIERELAEPDAEPRRALEALLHSESKGEVSDREIETFYRQNQERFSHPERVELRQILVDDKSAAEAAYEELGQGADFSEVARRVSIDPSAPYGGYQGELAREDLPVALAATIFALEDGAVSEIVEADYGFHIFYVGRRLPPQVQPLEEAREEIRTILSSESSDRVIERLLEEARERYQVSILEEKLPFTYE